MTALAIYPSSTTLDNIPIPGTQYRNRVPHKPSVQLTSHAGAIGQPPTVPLVGSFHKSGNVLDKMLKSVQSKATTIIREIWQAPALEEANGAHDQFCEAWTTGSEGGRLPVRKGCESRTATLTMAWKFALEAQKTWRRPMSLNSYP